MKHRIESIDILRGIVMVIMALDHVRAFYLLGTFGSTNPTDIETTTVPLFLTRFITHICAPVFLFLAGTSAFLFEQKSSKNNLAKFLFTRGLWLIFIEIFVITFLWYFDPAYTYINLQVIWVIGICMMLMAAIIYLPMKTIIYSGLVIIIAHHGLEGFQFEKGNPMRIIFGALYNGGWFKFESLGIWYSFVYTVIPWIALMMIGYGFGQLYSKQQDERIRKQWLYKIGLGMIILFFVLRFINGYGDAKPWQSYDSLSKTILSFFNVSKYPASLDFILITMGPSLILLAWIEKFKNHVTQFFIVFGQVPFFFYVLHFLVIHGFAIILLEILGQDGSILILVPEAYSNEALKTYGYPLGIVYLIWIGITFALYPICNAYRRYKANNRDKTWLSYL